jgi:methylase of polypeptide subunit release factors
MTALLEIDPDQKEKIAALIKRDFPLTKIIILKDLEDFERVVIAEI